MDETSQFEFTIEADSGKAYKVSSRIKQFLSEPSIQHELALNLRAASPIAAEVDLSRISPAQLAANRANAQKSTGLRTEAGLAKSSKNGVKSALTGRTVLLPTDEVEEYAAFLAEFQRSLHPVGMRESELVQIVVDCHWRLRRIQELEYALYAHGERQFAETFSNEPACNRHSMVVLQTHLTYEKELRNLHPQESRIERKRVKALAELRELQAERQPAKEETADTKNPNAPFHSEKEVFAAMDAGYLPANIAQAFHAQAQAEMASNFQMRRWRRKANKFFLAILSAMNLSGVLILGVLLPLVPQLEAQVPTEIPAPVPGAKPLGVEHIKVHGRALEGNLEGNAVDRDGFVFLPPSYAIDTGGRYPVVYALHGYSIGAEQWTHEIHVPQTIEGAFAMGAKEMIVVLPDSKTVHNGSMYSSSVTTGDFEKFVSQDLVAYIDAHYRTIANRTSRGLAGHSMGGYGASRIGMKHPDVFGALYIMSPCCLSARPAGPSNPETEKALEAVKTPEDSAKLTFFLRAQLASAAAWSPDPKNPPLFLDLPFKDGVPQPDVLAKWAANAPLAFVDQYIGNLRQYHAIALDVGDQDGLRTDTDKLHQVLDKYGIANSFEIYHGTHTSAMADRFQNHVIKFFSQNLCFRSACP